MKYLPKTELEIIGKKGYLTDRGVLKIVIYKDEKIWTVIKKFLKFLIIKKGIEEIILSGAIIKYHILRMASVWRR